MAVCFSDIKEYGDPIADYHPLCNECTPLNYASGEFTRGGVWHHRFMKRHWVDYGGGKNTKEFLLEKATEYAKEGTLINIVDYFDFHADPANAEIIAKWEASGVYEYRNHYGERKYGGGILGRVVEEPEEKKEEINERKYPEKRTKITISGNRIRRS